MLKVYKFLIFLILFIFPFFVIEVLASGKQEIKIQSQDWMKSNLDYVKITTDRDAPAIVPLNQILNLSPNWIGLNSNYLHLFHNNCEVRFYLKDENGKLDANDTLYFLGSRSMGDTTYWDNYAIEEPFFLTYNENIIPKRYELIPNSLSVENTYQFIDAKKHIEKDIVRSYGKDLYDSHNSENEGWYWKEIIPEENQISLSTFTTFLNIESDDVNNIEIKVFFRSVTDTLLNAVGSNLYPEYRISLFFNNDSVDVKEFTRLKKDSFMLVFTPNKVFNGVNTITLKSKDVHPYRHGNVSIDYITLNYKSKPITDEYLPYFDLENVSQNSEILLDGFKSKNIISIDTINGKIQFPESVNSKFKIRITQKQNTPVFAVSWDDTASISFNNGMHLIRIPLNNKVPEELFLDYYSSSFNDFLKKSDDTDIIILGYNSTEQLNNQYVNDLKNFGIFLTKEVKNGDNIILVFNKSNLLSEKIYQSNFLNFNLELDQGPNNYFKSVIKIVPNIFSRIFVKDGQNFAKIAVLPVNKPYLKDSTNRGNVLVIYHSLFKSIAEKYSEIRKKTVALNYRLIDVEDIYNEFNYGKKSPFAIKELIKYAYNNWKDSLSTVVIIGNASWDPFKRSIWSNATDYVPCYGFPPADFWYTLLDEDNIPDISFGRISISNEQDGNNYLDKLNLYDNIPDQPWMKNFLFLSGGDTPSERRKFAYMKSYFFDDIIKTEPLCGSTDSVSKYDENVGGVSESGAIREKINNGAVWVNFVGHANQNIFDMDGWQTYKLNNYGKYSFFSTISCNTGAHADPGIINCRNEDYVFFKDKGFIGSIGSSTYGWVDENRYIVQRMISQLADSNSKLEFIGDLFNYGKNGLANEGAQLQTKFHSALIGDPLLKLRISKEPNLYIFPQEFTITNKDGMSNVNVNDTLAFIHIPIYNNGLKTSIESTVQILDYYKSQVDTFYVSIPEICNKYEFVKSIFVADKPGEHTVKVIIDPEKKIPNLKENNRIFQTTFYVFSSSLLYLDPFPQWNVNSNSPLFRFINPKNEKEIQYYFTILDDYEIPVYIGNDSEINIFENYLDWKPNITLNEGHYKLTGYYIDKNGLKSNLIEIPFSAQIKDILSNVSVLQNTEKTLISNELNNLTYDSLSNGLKIKDSYKTVRLLSVGGHKDLITWGNIEVGNDVYTDSQFLRGFNVVTFSINADSNNAQYRLFDTWKDGDDWKNDSSSVRLVQYLRDSIPDNNYVLIITSGLSWKIPVLNQMFQNTSSGSFDTLKAVLRNFGSKLIDSVTGPMTYEDVSWWGWKHSFVMIGRKGWKTGEAIEKMDPNGDSALIESELKFIRMNGSLSTPFLGKSTKWNKIVIESNSKIDSLNDFKINYEVIGKNGADLTLINSGTLNQQSQLLEIPDSLKILYKEIKINLDFHKLNEFSNPLLKSIDVNFTPISELAIIKSQTSIDDSSRNRGENTVMHISCENISPRTSSDSVVINIQNHSELGTSDFKTITIPILKSNSSILETVLLKNDNLYVTNNFELTLNSNNSIDEFYSFNNKYSLHYSVKEDTIKPNIDVTFDGKYVQDGDYVSQKPLIRIKIRDNSPLIFSDSSKIEVFINGAFIIPDSVAYYNFISYNSDDKIKCELQIRPKQLEFGSNKLNPSNNIRIIAKDYYGNSDTLLFKLNVALNNTLGEVSAFPNPAKENITFKYDFTTRHYSDYTKLRLVNLNGQEIFTERWVSTIGLNEHQINLKDNFGNSLPVGMYFYEISIESDIWTEPQNGYFIISK